MQVKVKKMFEDVVLPEYATPGSACFDIRAHISSKNGYTFNTTVFENAAIYSTGLQFEIPEGNVMLVFSRSGQGFKDNVRLANCVGVIDSDYRGELKVKLTKDFPNEGDRDRVQVVRHGDKIAQGMVIPYAQMQFVEVGELSDTVRGEGGFGSTGA